MQYDAMSSGRHGYSVLGGSVPSFGVESRSGLPCAWWRPVATAVLLWERWGSFEPSKTTTNNIYQMATESRIPAKNPQLTHQLNTGSRARGRGRAFGGSVRASGGGVAAAFGGAGRAGASCCRCWA